MAIRMSIAEYERHSGITVAPVKRAKGMNSYERWYAADLAFRKMQCEITDYRSESVSLRLAERTWYRPDFMVIGNDGSIEFVEVKGGFVREDSRVKFKAASAAFPWFTFRWVVLGKRNKGIEVVKEELWKGGVKL